MRSMLACAALMSLLAACSSGTKGDPGPAGPRGDPGDPGPQGATGLQGAVGPAGAQGPAGAAGPQGPEGPAGPVGPVGPKGLTWRGSWDPTVSYAADDAVELGGSAYVATGASIASQPPGPEWALLAAAGAEGPQGAAGPAGPTGPAGPQGIAGPPGPAGEVNYSAVIQNQSAGIQAASFSISGAATVGDLVAGTVTSGGAVQVGTSGTACDAAHAGTLRWEPASIELQVCDGTAWAGASMRSLTRAHGYGTDGSNAGAISSRSVAFWKRRPDTAVRISWVDNLRVQDANAACRWELKIDGASCSNPGPLVFDFYSGLAGDQQFRSQANFGTCVGVAAGSHVVQVYVAAMPGYSGGDCHTGSGQYWSLEVEEVR